MIQIVKMCGGSELDNENVWWQGLRKWIIYGNNDLDSENMCW